jgi:hypothetical protein
MSAVQDVTTTILILMGLLPVLDLSLVSKYTKALVLG